MTARRRQWPAEAAARLWIMWSAVLTWRWKSCKLSHPGGSAAGCSIVRERAVKQLLRWMHKGTRGIWLGAALCAALAAAASPLDNAVAGFIAHVMGGHQGILVRLVGDLGHGVTLSLTFLALTVFYGEVETGARGLLGLTGAALATDALRGIFQRTRPDGGPYSFPSAHAACAFAAAVVLAQRFPRLKYVFYVGAAGVATARVVWAKHFPSDVLAGAALGMVSALGAAALAERIAFLRRRRAIRLAAGCLLALFVLSVSVTGRWPTPLTAVAGPVVLLVLARRTTQLLEPSLSSDGKTEHQNSPFAAGSKHKSASPSEER